VNRALLTLSLATVGSSAGCYVGAEVGVDSADTDGAAESGGPGGSGNSGSDSDSDSDSDTGEPVEPPPVEVLERIGENGMRRLTAAEYSATVHDLLGVDVDAALLLPEDWRQPFDNDYTTQNASQALIDGAELLASDVAGLALEPGLRDATVGCTPAGPTDAACFQDFLSRFGRRALRRPMTEDDLSRYGGLIAEAEETGDFYDAVNVAIRALLQHPEFLYRVEVGTPVEGIPDVFALNDFEVATRLSYMLWGSTPSDALLDRAEDGGLSDAEGIRAAAEDMLLDPRAKERIGRFHALWLGYEMLPHAPELTTAMRAETQALIDKVIFDEALPWQDLLRSQETYLDATLAEHYGLPAPATPGWIDYADSGRKGLLSHGSFLSAMSKIDDSSPTKRGILVRTRLMCQVIPPPPPTVDVDMVEPEEGTCKEDFYREQHLNAPGCVSCHALMDPIGLGLENYDHTGAFRTVENDDESCVISGDGELDGTPFTGPSELSDLLIESGALNRCVAEQLYRFTMGRTELADIDASFIDFIVEQNGAEGDFDFAALTLAFVSEEAFRFRRNEAAQ
jgi:hypothetical protein